MIILMCSVLCRPYKYCAHTFFKIVFSKSKMEIKKNENIGYYYGPYKSYKRQLVKRHEKSG